jgi:hypothetical protein
MTEEEEVGVVRVRPARLGGPCAVRHPEHGEFVVPPPGGEYRADDPLVLAHPWLFVTGTQLAADATPEVVESTPIVVKPSKRRAR